MKEYLVTWRGYLLEDAQWIREVNWRDPKSPTCHDPLAMGNEVVFLDVGMTRVSTATPIIQERVRETFQLLAGLHKVAKVVVHQS